MNDVAWFFFKTKKSYEISYLSVRITYMLTKKISVVIPACNEAAVIDIPIKRCLEAFNTYQLDGEIIIMDSSTDDTPNIAQSLGCKVVSIPKQGIGKAYIEALHHVSGDYIIMGDADGTYDFMEINLFIDQLNTGVDFVMGSRLKGTIYKGAMPWSHRYIGTPILTWFINIFYHTNISDCNSGLRAITKSAYQSIQLQSWGWEYASEMVLKAARYGLRISEVNVSLQPDQRNRQPHLNPWLAGWTNLRLIFLLVSDKLFFKSGGFFFIIGSMIVLSLAFGPYTFFGFYIGMFYMFIGLILAIIGLQFSMTSILVKKLTFLHTFKSDSRLQISLSQLSFEQGLLALIGFGSIALGILIYVFINWKYTQTITNHEIKCALISLYSLIVGSHLFLHGSFMYLIRMNDDKRA